MALGMRGRQYPLRREEQGADRSGARATASSCLPCGQPRGKLSTCVEAVRIATLVCCCARDGSLSLRRCVPAAPFQALLTSLQPVGTLDANGKPTLLGDRPLWMEVSKYFEPSSYFATLARMRGTSRNLRQAVDDQAAVIRALSEAFDVCAAAARESSLGGSEPTLDDDEDDEDDSDDSGDEDPEQRMPVRQPSASPVLWPPQHARPSPSLRARAQERQPPASCPARSPSRADC
jgi:hypothetical protein